jgi:hypothetical protein
MLHADIHPWYKAHWSLPSAGLTVKVPVSIMGAAGFSCSACGARPGLAEIGRSAANGLRNFHFSLFKGVKIKNLKK